jgi:hypothetical protein
MSQATEVEARFGEDGQITVLGFTWQGRRLPATGAGRQWSAADGLHFLVMTPGERVFELAYQPASGLWRVVRGPEQSIAA